MSATGNATGRVDVVCRYLVKPGKEADVRALLERHWDTLRGAGLTTERPATLVRGEDFSGRVAFVETFSWRDAEAVQQAHESPVVMRLWEPIGALCDSMEFWHGQTLAGRDLWS